MQKLAALVLVAVLPIAAACGSDDDASTADTTADATSDTTADATSDTTASGDPCLSPDQEAPAPEYVGLDEVAAEELAASSDLVLRVVGIDGECLPTTMDLREDRVNVELVDGVVVAAAKF